MKWPAVVVIVALLMVLGWLSYAGKDATTVLAGVIAVLGALGFGYQFTKTSEIQQSTAKIEENTNGRIGQLTRLVEQQRQDMMSASDQHRRDMREMAEKLAAMMPAEAVSASASVSGAGVYADREHSHSSDL